MILAQPGHEGGGKGIGVARGAECVQAKREGLDFGVHGIVQGHDFDGMAITLMNCREAPHGSHRAPTGGADGSDDVKEFHGGRELLRARGESLHGLYLLKHGAVSIV
jgi:hypothetical protein